MSDRTSAKEAYTPPRVVERRSRSRERNTRVRYRGSKRSLTRSRSATHRDTSRSSTLACSNAKHSRYRNRSPKRMRKRRTRISRSIERSRSMDSKSSKAYRGRSRSRLHKNKKRSRAKRRHVCTSSVTSTTISSSSESNSSSHRRSLAKSNHTKSRKQSVTSKSKESSVMEKLIDALNKRNESSFIGAKDVIPNFDPSQKNQTMTSWLKKVNETARIYYWNDKEIIYNALPKLAGLSRRWYEGLPSVRLNWKEWQAKLLKSFPDDQNYADKLIEMLDRKSKRDETLEEYFYDKAKLVNHCGIKGKNAVDCIIQGIYDNNVRLNALGSDFRRPSRLLKYLRNISCKSIKEIKKTPMQTKESIRNNKQPSFKVRCYNCSELGHTVPKCTKAIQKCPKCNRMGHLGEHCKRDADKDKHPLNPVNKVQLIEASKTSHNIYTKNITVNGIPKTAFVDFGSECTLIKQSTSDELKLDTSTVGLPVLKGFASGVVLPLGKASIEISVDFVTAVVDVFIVHNEFLNTDVLVGQTLTELPEVRVYKTNSNLVLYSAVAEAEKSEVYVKSDVEINGLVGVDIHLGSKHTGLIYLPGNTCFKTGEEMVIPQGLYAVKNGVGKILVINLSGDKFTLLRGKLIARANLLPISLAIYSDFQRADKLGIYNLTVDQPSNNKPDPLTMDMLKIGSETTDKQRQLLLNLVNEYRDCFALNVSELGTSTISEMHITLTDSSPVSYKPYRLPYSERIVVQKLVNELLENNIVKESNSSYASPIVLVKKKNNDYRLCVDYRALNKKTVKDSYPMPVIDDQLDRLNGKRFFTSLDLKSGYYQIPMATDSTHMTAFVTPDGHFEYTRMPFGLVNAPAVFQHMINKALGKDRFDLALPYMDDILTPATDVDEGMEKLRKIFDCLRKAGLTLNIEKCFFFETKLDYLGYEISKEGLRPGSRKTEAVALFPAPSNVHQVRQFVGLASFFRRFVPNFASIAKPLTALTKANTPWVWSSLQEEAFHTIKTKLIERPILALYDTTYITEVHCDASKLGVGGILLQKPDEKSPPRPVAYFSKQTTKDEEYLHSYELETLAVVLSLKKFRIYLIGIQFKVFTDCNALRTTLTKRDLMPRIARWWLLLQEYDFRIEYRPGDNMKHVDALSRNPIASRDSLELLDAREYDVMNISTTDWLQTVQMSDPKLQHIKLILKSNKKEVKDIHTNFLLQDDKVYRIVGDQKKWVVPNGARWRICQLCHDEMGHFAAEKTLDKIKQDYWFPKMKRFVCKYVEACLSCAYNKASTSKPTGYLHPIPKGNVPFHTLHMDHLGPFVRSKKGNSYILGVIDGFSKFIFIKPVKDVKTKTTIKTLQEIFDVIGSPNIMITDRGTSFTSAGFKGFVKLIGARHVLNAVATPRANGQIERYNRTILESLAATNHDQVERDWDVRVGKLQWSLNNMINKTTGKSPSEIVFGRRTICPGEGPILNELADLKDTSEPGPSRDAIRSAALENTTKCQQYMKKKFDSGRAPTKFFKIDDLVMIPNHHNPADGKSKKLCPKFRGPLKITAILENDRYEVSSIEGHSKRKYKSVYPADQLKRWITFAPSNDTDGEDNDFTSNEADERVNYCSDSN